MNDDADKAPPGCVRLIGASLWSRTGSAVEHLLSLRSELARANDAQGLRCALLHSSGWLVQWFEGPAQAVDDAWDTARKDGRAPQAGAMWELRMPTLSWAGPSRACKRFHAEP